MKIDMIILGLASLWAIYWTFRNQHIFSGLVTAGLVAGISLAFIKLNGSSSIGISIFVISSLMAILYTLLYKKFSFSKRIVITLIALPSAIYWIFLINHLPGAEWLWYGLFLPFVGLIYGWMKPVNLKNERGFILILLAESLSHIYPVLLN